ncbi:MAG: hypothetical protein IBX69_17490 [Anaerolineales bacterium]|nr:hypothetical protein [Anaerolineales bacterium]
MTPAGEGAVSWYDYPEVVNENIKHPKDLVLEKGYDQRYYTMQGSVKLNRQIWNYVKSSNKWEKNEWASNICNPLFASYSQCVIPLQFASPPGKPVTGAVLVENGKLSRGRESIVIIKVDDGIFPYENELMVNIRDECPGCKPLQVDILSLNQPLPTYNSRGGDTREVYIWAAIPK